MASPIEDLAKEQGPPQKVTNGFFNWHKKREPTFKAACDIHAFYNCLPSAEWPGLAELKPGDHFINLRSREVLKVEAHCQDDLFKYTHVRRGVGAGGPQDIKKGDEFYVLGQAGKKEDLPSTQYGFSMMDRCPPASGIVNCTSKGIDENLVANERPPDKPVTYEEFSRECNKILGPDPNDPVAVCRHRDEQACGQAAAIKGVVETIGLKCAERAARKEEKWLNGMRVHPPSEKARPDGV